MKEAYKLESAKARRALGLYDSTDFESLDRQTVDAYQSGTMNRALQAAMNYDAQAAGAGSSIFKGDTAKGRMRSQIFGDASSRVADLEASLASSRAGRKAALLPGSNSGAMLQAGAMLDGQAQAADQASMQGLVGLGTLLAQSLRKPVPKSTPPFNPSATSTTANNIYGIDFTTPSSALGLAQAMRYRL